MEFHPAANLFPLDDENLEALSDDIRTHGLLCPIETYSGKIVDGRRRWLACKMAGIEPETVTVAPDDPVAYVLSLNLHRRHLTPSQRAMVAARARELYDKQAKERMKAGGGDRKSDKAKSGVENLPPPIHDASKARDAAGKAVGVSGRSVDFATKVLKQGTPELIKAVDEGRMAVSTAAVYASEPMDVQVAEATKPKRNRTYQSVSKPPANGERQKEPKEAPEGVSRGVGIELAHEAIACLKRIPKNDSLRNRGFQVVMDWIRHNK